ncbi:MAG: oligosaccharide flippase family protein [Pseudomonadota bacterium]
MAVQAPASRAFHILALGAGAGAVLSQGVVLAVTYWLVRERLGTEALGLWALVMALLAFGRATEFGLSQSLMHFLPKAMREQSEHGTPGLAQTYLDTVLGSSALLFTGFGLLILLAGPGLLQAATEPGVHATIAAVLPPAALGFVLTNTALVGTNALIGLQKPYLGNLVTILGAAANLVAVLALLGPLGLSAMGYGYAVQGAVMLAAGLGLTAHRMGALPRPWRIQRVRFREIIGLGLGLQGMSILSVLADSALKFLVNHFLGLAATGALEMAHRFILFVRGIFSLPQTYLSAQFSKLAGDRAALRAEMRRAFHVAVHLACLFVAVVLVTRFWIGDLWAGADGPAFAVLTLALTGGWAVNILATPVYFYCVGTNQMRCSLIGQTTYAGGVIVLGMAVGPLGEAWVMALAATVALGAGHTYLTLAGLALLGLGWRDLIPPSLGALVPLVALTGAAVLWLEHGPLAGSSLEVRALALVLIGLCYLGLHGAIAGRTLRRAAGGRA